MAFKGKSALITGSGSGIGKALALALAGKGCNVTLADIKGPEIKSLSDEISSKYGVTAIAVTCDITNDSEQKALFKQHTDTFNSLNFALLNAGVPEKGDILAVGESGPWEETFNTNLRAQLVGARLAILAMSETKSKGGIVFTSSSVGFVPCPYFPVYASCKAALNHFAVSSAPRLLPRGIRIGTVCPSTADTDLVVSSKEFAYELAKVESTSTNDVDQAFDSLGILPVEEVVKGALYILEDPEKTGVVVFIQHEGVSFEYAPDLVKSLQPVSLDKSELARISSQGLPDPTTTKTAAQFVQQYQHMPAH